jgi:hypothetical protein
MNLFRIVLKNQIMKKAILLFLLGGTLLFQNNVSAQYNVAINEVYKYMSLGEKAGLEVAIVEAIPSDVEKSWMKFMRQYKTKAKKPRKEIEIFADDATITDMSDNTVDVYAIAEVAEYGTKLTVFFNLGGSFVSSREHEIAFGAAKRILRNFALSEAANTIENELKLQEKVLKDLNNELDKMLSSKASNIKDVEKAKSIIEQKTAELEAVEKAIATKQKQISIQKEIMQTLENKLNLVK